jgi:hypothetical protein
VGHPSARRRRLEEIPNGQTGESLKETTNLLRWHRSRDGLHLHDGRRRATIVQLRHQHQPRRRTDPGTETPLYVADEAVRRNLSGSIATPMDWADYLIWKTDGRLKPLVHSHVHLTEEQTWKDYEALYRGEEHWLEKLHQHKLQYVLVSRQRYPQLAKLVLLEDRTGPGRVRIIYQDQRCLLAEVLPPKPKKLMPL